MFVAIMCTALSSKSQSAITGTILQAPCHNDGRLAVHVSNLTPPISFTYVIPGFPTIVHANVNSNADTITGLPGISRATLGGAPGSVVVIASSAGSGPVYGQFTIQPAFQLLLNNTIGTCPSPSTFQIVPSGGSSPFSYIVTDLYSGQVHTTHPLVSSGTHNFNTTVTDANGCSVTSLEDTLGQRRTLHATISSTPASCTNGVASVNTITGGVAPYSFLWNTGQSTPAITGLINGLYTCTITGADGCNKSVSEYVQQTPAIQGSLTVTNALCQQNDGSIACTPGGGIPPYTFQWSNGATTQTVSGLPGGNNTYYVIITDSQGCIGTAHAIVHNNTSLAATYATTPSSCSQATGSATLTPSGGTPPYSISWSTVPGNTTTVIQGKASGHYDFQVTDATGCTFKNSLFISSPGPGMSAQITTQPNCLSLTGNILLWTGLHDLPHTYLWSNGATTQSLFNVPTGAYSCTITNSKGCQLTTQALLTAQSAININVSTIPASCRYTADGSISISAGGTAGPYTFQWSDGHTGPVNTGIAAGTYWVKATDANGCSVDKMIELDFDAGNTSCYCTVQGTVYNDVNANCLKDAGEPGIPNVLMHISGGDYTYTDINGGYRFYLPSGTYTLTETTPVYHSLAGCQVNNIPLTITASAGCVHHYDFANSSVTAHDLSIIAVDQIQAVPGGTYKQRLIIRNNGTIPEPLPVHSHTHDGKFHYNNASSFNYVQSNQGISPHRYELAAGSLTLAPYEVTSSMLNYDVPASANPSTVISFYDTVAYAAPMANWLADHTPDNNTYAHQTTIAGSYALSYKEVNPKGQGPQGYISTNDSILHFIIHFHNPESYRVKDIMIEDSLDPNLAITSVVPGYSDHPYHVTMSQTGVLRFYFDSIMLPPAPYNPTFGSGMVMYSAHLKPNLPTGTRIRNTARIFIDQNNHITTNTTLNTIGSIVSVHEQKSNETERFRLFPNPATDIFHLASPVIDDETVQYTITDLNGRVLECEWIKLPGGQAILDRSTTNLESGIYFIRLQNAHLNLVQKLIVIR